MKYLKPNELLKVLTEARKQGIREHAMFLLAYHHGLRASEISRFQLADVDMKRGEVYVRRLKGSLQTRQPIKSHDNPLLDEKAVLTAYLRERGDADSSLLFVSRLGSGICRAQVYNLFNRCSILAGVGQRGSHCLKHSLGRHLVDQNVPLPHIQLLLGHRDLKSTACYLSISQEEAAKAATNALQTVFA